ncbi:transient receptor potential cation channel subfamily M member-like 2 [Branchiostoma floridae]|uniref:Transient receptor potential cation channel subfamily M member-like 2 n=1 Tax=Branchiostoma floridae TaxID=7739 RepID=A0A9J7N0B5_BRAFL|nr:transient receptor potential cation channel subfamily M member-like 2 [Branchiostoma floridae]
MVGRFPQVSSDENSSDDEGLKVTEGAGVVEERLQVPPSSYQRPGGLSRRRSRFRQKRRFPRFWRGVNVSKYVTCCGSDSEDSEVDDLQEELASYLAEQGNQGSTTSLQFQLPQGSYMEGVLPLRYGEESRPYLLLNKVNCPSMEVISEHLHRTWRIERPKVILSLYCEPEHFSLWKRRKIYDALQTGLIKLASTTNMWLITNGANLGVGKLVGDAMKREKARREYIVVKEEEDQPMLRAVGISPFCAVAHMLPRWRTIQDGVRDQWELNPDHTHFIVVDDGTDDNWNAEHELRLQLQHHYRSPRQTYNVLPGTTSRKKANPVVCVLVQGGPASIQYVQGCVQQETPVLLLKGSGKAADLLAFAYEEIKERPPQEDWMQYLRAELSRRIFKTFPKLSQEEVQELKESIIDCVNDAIKEDQVFLSILEVQGFHDDLENLDKYILTAILKAQADVSDDNVVQSDLQLTLQWNRPDLALSEIFQSPYFPDNIKIPPRLFEKALLKKDREEFVELFLSQGFDPGDFLTRSRYRRLFEKADDREFIKGVFGAMGYNLPDFGVLPDNFLTTLKKVICQIAEVEVYFFCHEDPTKERPNTERAALMCLSSFQKKTKVMMDLLLWAILVNKQRLVRIIWEQTEDPIPLALYIRRVYMSLTKFVEDTTLRKEMETLVVEYEDLAVGVLDTGYKESTKKATDILNEMIPDLKVKTAIEVAYDSKCKKFIAHPCCRKWVKRKYMGGISVKKTMASFLPSWLKILLSAFLIFPMFFFIDFRFLKPTVEEQKAQRRKELLRGSQQSGIQNSVYQNPIYQHVERQVEEGCEASCRYCTGYHCNCTLNTCLLNFFRRVKALWTAPITKYWAHVLCYMIFLFLLSLSGLLPGCGNILLDMAISLWMTTSIVELIRTIYRDNEMFKSSSGWHNVWGYTETVLIVLFWVAHFVVKVVGTRVGFVHPKDAKLLLAIMVFFFFLRLLYVFAPNSLSLGPRLVMLRKMIQIDLVVFFRLLVVFMCIHGVVSQILLQPWHQLDSSVVEMLVWRPWLHVWLTPYSYLEGNCDSLVVVPPPDQPPSWYAPNVTMPTCPAETSDACEGHWFLYMSLSFYLICVRFGLLTVLFAMFNKTYQRVHGESREIWMYQRYKLIIDLDRRDSLPPPLVIFHYIYMLGRYLCWCWKCRVVTKIKVAYGEKTYSSQDMVDGGLDVPDGEELDEDRFSFWKSCAHSFNSSQRKQAAQESRQMTQTEVYEQVSDDLSRLDVRVRRRHDRLHDRVVKVEKMMQESMLTLETIKHLLLTKESREVEGVSTTQTGAILHIAARQSPYFGTKKKRFPVFDKYVPWKVLFVEYDPPRYTAPMEYFSEWFRQFADEVDPSTQKPAPVWNEVVGYKMQIWREGEGGEREQLEEVMEVDRRSWIEDKDKGVGIRYNITSEGVPQNPMGRTGLRGKGALFRWGPNHSMLAICTRWKRSVDPATGDEQEEYLLVEGKRVLEFLSYKEPDFEEWAIPGAMTAGLESKYSVLHRAFCTKALGKQLAVVNRHMDESKVKQLFEAYTVDERDCTPSERDDPIETFSAAMIYRGYVDDPRNTDSAWVETEAWHFHYESGENFLEEEMVAAGSRWQEVSRHVKLFASHASVIQEAAARLNAYF